MIKNIKNTSVYKDIISGNDNFQAYLFYSFDKEFDLIFIDAAKAQNINFFNKYKENLNKYALLLLNFIKKYRKSFYFQLIMEGNLYQYLLSVGKNSEEKVNDLMQKFMKNDTKLSEKFKEKDSLEWAKLMNNYKKSKNNKALI